MVKANRKRCRLSFISPLYRTVSIVPGPASGLDSDLQRQVLPVPQQPGAQFRLGS